MRALLFPALLASTTLAAQEQREPDESAFRSFVERHCFECHGREEPEAGLDLRFADAAAARARLDDLLLVAERLRAGEMPPPERARPEPAEIAAAVAWIESITAEPLRPVLRRLNAREYENSVRDLFGVEFRATALFPADSPSHGFDTVGAGQSLSTLMLEKLFDAAESVARAAIVVPEASIGERYAGGEIDGLEHEGTKALYAEGDVEVVVELPRAGQYRLTVRAYAQQAGPEAARLALCVDGVEQARFDVPEVRALPGEHAARVACAGGARRIGVRFLNDYWRPEADPEQRDRNLFVEWLEVEGPLDARPATGFQIELFERFGPELGERRLRAVLEHVATRVWRRPPAESELEALSRLAPRDASIEEATQLALQALLSAPQFLFLLEPNPPDAAGVRELDGWELAARLACFLWSSTPDEELLELARSGTLGDETVLAGQVQRMLADEKAGALASGFASQWLQIERLARAATERAQGEEAALFDSMRGETLRFFEALMREDRSALELLSGDFTFVDDALAAHYGVEPSGEPDAAGFRRASLQDTPRRGVLGHASVLTVTSEATRTAPVKRGKWILEALIGDPTPPPPPGVDDLDDSPESIAAASLRERLERHRAEPACSACHARLDPLGFGLEGFDMLGRWRAEDGAFAIDDRGELPDGRAFAGPLELAELLRADGRFLAHLVEELCVYALGRPIGPGDAATIEEVLARLDPERPTLRGMIAGIVASRAFTTRAVEAP